MAEGRLGHVAVSHRGGRRNRFFGPLVGELEIRLAEERRRRAGSADLRTHSAVGEPEEQLEGGLDAVRLHIDHAQPARDCH